MHRRIALLIAVLLTLCGPAAAEDEAQGKDGLPVKAALASSVSSSGLHVISGAAAELPDKPARPDRTDFSNPDLPARTLGPLQLPALLKPAVSPEGGVQWSELMKGSLLYLGVMHSFRLATEQGTRDGLSNNLFSGYFQALGAMHGWSDGDSYYENYLGHPIEGAVSGYIWIHNDRRFRAVQFGANREYWMSRLRAYAFAWAFSEQFEIGPISEASIGQIQRYCCAYGFVDHIITPNGALVWMVAGDALDRYVTVPLENRTHNTAARILTRLALNPPQSFANLMMFQYPWHRENRATVTEYAGQMNLRSTQSLQQAVDPRANPGGFDDVPQFEVSAAVPGFYQIGGLNCLGGGGVGAVRASDFWQWTLEVNGCTLGNSLPRYWSGDSLTFAAGPQWIVHSIGRWAPHAHFRVGVQKITEEKVDPEKKLQVLSDLPPGASANDYRHLYTQHWESTGFTLSVGGGVDFALNRALALRVANVDYTRSWLGTLNGTNFDRGVRFGTGLVLRIGTW